MPITPPPAPPPPPPHPCNCATSFNDCKSNGIDVDPRCGCANYDDAMDVDHAFCYVLHPQGCAESISSQWKSHTAWKYCTVLPPPSPPSPPFSPPASPSPPPPLPSPPPPAPPPSAGAVVLVLTASGSVTDAEYQPGSSGLQQKIANAAGVDKSFVTIDIQAASVKITATIAVPVSTSAIAVKASLDAALSTVELASAKP